MALQRGGTKPTFTDLELESGQGKAEPPPPAGTALGILRLASVNMVGFDPENSAKNNQDACFGDAMFTAPNTGFFVVADGHGEAGHFCSNFVVHRLATQLQQVLRDSSDFKAMASSAAPSSTRACAEVNKLIKSAFLTVNKTLLASEIDTNMSGSTCCTALLAGNKLITANVGDSRCIGAYAQQHDGTVKLVARALTTDHKPDLPKEKARILASGGRVAPWAEAGLDEIFRVWLKSEDTPGLAMSRSFGDQIAATVGIIAEPEIAHYVIEEGLAFVLLASDGVWEFMSDQEVVDAVWEAHTQGRSFHQAIDSIACMSSAHWMRNEGSADDITIIALAFDPRL